MDSIREVIVVEGKNDEAAVRRALPAADVIQTSGLGLDEGKLALIGKACETRGIIILTDPDGPGEKIRRTVKEKFPEAKEAFVPRNKARKNGDIGIENAEPEDILKALKAARGTPAEKRETFSQKDLLEAGLVGDAGAAGKREELGNRLGIGYGNASAFLRKLNGYGITKEEFHEALRSGQS